MGGRDGRPSLSLPVCVWVGRLTHSNASHPYVHTKEDFLVRKTRRQSAYDEMRLREEAERRRREEEALAEAEAARYVMYVWMCDVWLID